MSKPLTRILAALPLVALPSLAFAQEQPAPPPPPGAATATGQVSIGTASTAPPSTAASQQQQPVYMQQTPYGPQPVYVQPGPYGQQPAYYPPPAYAPPMDPAEQERIASQQRWGRVWRAGAITFGVMYGLTALVGLAVGVSSSGAGQTEALVACIPIAGPFAAIAVAAPRHSAFAGEIVLYTLDGLVQIGGAFMLIYGAIRASEASSPASAPRTARNHHGIADWSVVPMAPGASVGASLSVATF